MNTLLKSALNQALSSLGGIEVADNATAFTALRESFLADEDAALNSLLATAKLNDDANTNVQATARSLVESVRSRQKQNVGMQSFLTQYDLSTQEGVLLMCVAEALLRIPDAATADKLIKDKFGQGDWNKHLGASDSLLVNAGTWGMMLTGKLVSVNPTSVADVGGWITRLAARAGEPIVRTALRQGMKLMAKYLEGDNEPKGTTEEQGNRERS